MEIPEGKTGCLLTTVYSNSRSSELTCIEVDGEEVPWVEGYEYRVALLTNLTNGSIINIRGYRQNSSSSVYVTYTAIWTEEPKEVLLPSSTEFIPRIDSIEPMDLETISGMKFTAPRDLDNTLIIAFVAYEGDGEPVLSGGNLVSCNIFNGKYVAFIVSDMKQGDTFEITRYNTTSWIRAFSVSLKGETPLKTEFYDSYLIGYCTSMSSEGGVTINSSASDEFNYVRVTLVFQGQLDPENTTARLKHTNSEGESTEHKLTLAYYEDNYSYCFTQIDNVKNGDHIQLTGVGPGYYTGVVIGYVISEEALSPIIGNGEIYDITVIKNTGDTTQSVSCTTEINEGYDQILLYATGNAVMEVSAYKDEIVVDPLLDVNVNSNGTYRAYIFGGSISRITTKRTPASGAVAHLVILGLKIKSPVNGNTTDKDVFMFYKESYANTGSGYWKIHLYGNSEEILQETHTTNNATYSVVYNSTTFFIVMTYSGGTFVYKIYRDEISSDNLIATRVSPSDGSDMYMWSE